MIPAVLTALAAAAAAQSPMPYSGDAAAPAASSAPAVAASTEAPAAVAASTEGAKIAVAEKPKLSRPMHAVIHAEAADWEPVSLKAGGDPFQVETKATLREEKVNGKYKGTASRAAASARLHKSGRDHWLVVSVFPKALERRRRHFEIRFKIFEGFVEEAKVALVTVVDRRAAAGKGLDSFELRETGVEFEEDSPASGALSIAALDPRPSKSAFNAGALKAAAFADQDAGVVNASWSVRGLPAAR
ncbi:MAG: hypothetical protein ACHQ49_01060 [Elusimicrobiota bacterium]